MKWTIERVAHPTMASPGFFFIRNIVGAIEYNSGQAQEITGVVAQGNTLAITLIEPQGDFLSIIAMPFFCAVPTSMPPTEQLAPIPWAGPYYVSAHTINQRLSAIRNPNYTGPRSRTEPPSTTAETT